MNRDNLSKIRVCVIGSGRAGMIHARNFARRINRGQLVALADAHADASRVEELIRRERPEIADVVVHTEPR